MELDHLQPRDSAWQLEAGSLQWHRLGSAPWAAHSGPGASRVCPGKDTGSQDTPCLDLAASGFCLLALGCPTHPSAVWEWPLTVQLLGSKPWMSTLHADIPWRWDVLGLLLLLVCCCSKMCPCLWLSGEILGQGEASALQPISDTSSPWVVGNQNVKWGNWSCKVLLGLVTGRETHGLSILDHVFHSLPAGRGRTEMATHPGSRQKLRKWI